MLIRNILHYIKEAFLSIGRNGWMSFASVSVVAVSLFILGTFYLVNLNAEHITAELESQVEIIAEVAEDLTAEEIEQLRVTVIQLPEVEEVRFVSKSEALQRLKERMGEEWVEGYEDEERNPLPHSFEIRTIVPQDVPVVAGKLEKIPGIADVEYGAGVVEKLFRVGSVVRWIGLTFMVGLAVTAMFLIANTIKLTVNTRSKEIMIMKWVGATEWFIRWPFVIEGIILGLIGALIPSLLLYYLYGEAVNWSQTNINFLPLLPSYLVIGELIKLLLLLGTIIGALGSALSVRRFLKV